ncbi:ATP-dependent Clp protease ATP-binding subunit, partial [Streptomyces triticirhizae]
MGPDDFGRDPLGEYLARLFGGAGGAPGGGGARGERGYRDFLRLMSEPAWQLVSGAASYAAQHGSDDLDTEHLLRAALTTEPTRSMVARSGADPDALAEEIDSHAGEGPTRSSISVSPAAKRALMDAHRVALASGARYIGPEHLLLALAANKDSAAGRTLGSVRFDPAASAPPPPPPPAGAR